MLPPYNLRSCLCIRSSHQHQPMSDVRCPMSDVRCPMSDVRDDERRSLDSIARQSRMIFELSVLSWCQLGSGARLWTGVSEVAARPSHPKSSRIDRSRLNGPHQARARCCSSCSHPTILYLVYVSTSAITISRRPMSDVRCPMSDVRDDERSSLDSIAHRSGMII